MEACAVAGNKDRITVAQMARVWLAPVGSLAPAGPAADLDPDWTDVGFFTPDSLQFATDPSFEEIRSHQSNWPTRRIHTQDAATAQVDLQEWSATNFKAVYGGGTVTTIAAVTGPPAIPEHYKFVPPAIGGRSETACIIEIIDGAKHYRRIIPRCEQSEGVEQTFNKTSESTLPLRLTILGSDVGDAFYDLTDDPGFDPGP
uniref:phage tail tube protein n=1 Tax=Nonomuraea sp. CA-251285 TaxID=3240002 RepID=UPI003F491122